MPADVKRIEEMEKYLNECTEAVRGLGEQLDNMDAVRDKMISLFQYYGSEAWYEDREGEVPKDVPAGVLSEDLVYDGITEVRDLAFRMIESGTDILKNRL